MDDKDWVEQTVIDEEPDYESLCEEKNKEIERLKKEKEFLLKNYSLSKIIPIAQSEKEARNAILKAMQQSLKEN